MNVGLVLAGVFLALFGVYVIRSPMSVRSFASAKTWKLNPDKAERIQYIWAYAIGGTLVVGGLITVVLGLAA